MGQRAYCDQPHPGGDAEADRYCESYHRVRLPRSPRAAVVEWVNVHYTIRAARVGGAPGPLGSLDDLSCDAEAVLRRCMAEQVVPALDLYRASDGRVYVADL